MKIVAVSPSVLHRAAARMRTSVGEQLRNVNGEQQGDQNINRDDQEKSHEGKQNRVTKERIDSAEKNSREGSTDDGGLAAQGIGCHGADGVTAGVPIVISKEYLNELAMPRPCCTKKVGSRVTNP